MMPAKSHDQSKAAPSASKSQPEAGFGKVLSSIEGLQQRLDDFSIEDVKGAQAQAETLIQQLTFIQFKMSGLPLIKKALVEAEQTIASLPDETVQFAALSALQKYSSLHALLTIAGRLQEAVRACPERPKTVGPAVKRMAARNAPPSTLAPALSDDSADWVLGDIETITHGVEKSEPSDDRATMPSTADVKPTPAFEFGSERAAGTSAVEISNAQSGRTREEEEVRSNSQFDQRLLDDLIKSYGDFAGLSRTGKAPESPSMPPPIAVPKTPVAGPPAPWRDPAEARSLVTAPSTAKANPGPVPVPKPGPVLAPPAGQTGSAQSGSLLPQIDAHPTLPAQAASADLISFVEARPAKPVVATPMSLTRRGDIDRQLKRIIKDYGEYDLYSHRSSLNTKIAGIIAFALLGLVMVAFYFFKTPAAETDHPAAQSESTSISASPAAAGKAPSESGTKTTENK